MCGGMIDECPRGWTLIALAGTVGLGALLRAFLAGSGWLPGGYVELRHAHTHLGWYGVVLPASIAAWRTGGLGAAYGAAVAVATVGFVAQGYGPVAIAASTLVLAWWLLHGWRLWRDGAARGWFAPAPPSVIAAAVAIPSVAATLRRDPALSQALVAGFLAALLLGVALPAAARRAGLPPPRGRVLTLAVLATALYLGPLPIASPLAAGPVALGVLLLRAASSPGWTDLRLLIAIVGIGLVAAGIGLLPWSRAVAVAAVHFGLLGPVLHGLLLEPPTGRAVAGVRWLHHGSLGAMCAAIIAPAPTVAAVAGVAVAGWWLIWVALRVAAASTFFPPGAPRGA